jgi:hypothetical protein
MKVKLLSYNHRANKHESRYIPVLGVYSKAHGDQHATLLDKVAKLSPCHIWIKQG